MNGATQEKSSWRSSLLTLTLAPKTALWRPLSALIFRVLFDAGPQIEAWGPSGLCGARFHLARQGQAGTFGQPSSE